VLPESSHGSERFYGPPRKPSKRSLASPSAEKPAERAVPVHPVGPVSPLELAGFVPRAVAFMIDFLLLVIVETVLLFGSDATSGGLVSIVVGGAYQWYFLVDRGGQTLGKMFMRIRVIKTDGSALTTPDALLRYGGYLINFIPFLMGMGWFWALVDRRRQGWHDKLARTIVVMVDSLPGATG
jgi:uncharacterized RDD family membrane protein YckC